MDLTTDDFVSNEVSELIDMSVANSKINIKQFVASELIEIKPPTKLLSSNTFIEETKSKKINGSSNVRDRQSKAVKSSIERPQVARDRLKTKETVKQVVLPHNPGYLPKYLRDKMSNPSKSSFVRPKTTESTSSIQVHFKLTPEQEKEFDIKSVTSVQDIQKVSEVEELNKKIMAQSKTINRDKTQIQELKQRTLMLEKQCEELQSTVNRMNEELKSSNEQNKALDKQLVRYYREKKEWEFNASAMEKLKIEIDNLLKENEKLKSEMTEMRKVKSDEILQMQNKIDRLNNDFKTQKKSCEILIDEKNQLQLLLNSKSCCENKEDGDKMSHGDNGLLLDKIEILEKEIRSRLTEISHVKEDNRILSEENGHLKSQLATISNDVRRDNTLKLEKKINQLRAREEELCQQLLTLNSKLENEKCENESKEILLKHRADHIRTLQDAGNISNARILFQIKEIEELRDELKHFEKFKLAHEEERDNLKRLFNQNFKKNTN